MSTEVPEIKTPYDKILALINENEKEIQAVKSTYDSMKSRQKQLRKLVQKMQNKALKSQNKPKPNRKPCGFARPSPVSKEMCDFLKVAHDTMVSRTDVTKALISYIKEHGLQNPQNKRQILPDETLYKLFGEESKSVELTYFTMQKYVNRHFPKTDSATASNVPPSSA